MKLSIFILLIPFALFSNNCNPYFAKAKSARNANYIITLELDHLAKKINAKTQLEWINSSPDTILEMRFYMYLNAFKNTNSTFLKGATDIFGQNFTDRTAEEWGWIEMRNVLQMPDRLSLSKLKYIQPDDGNMDDESVLQVFLANPVLPGDTLHLEFDFIAKMPKIIARTGYADKDYFAFLHWFPQVGVYEKNKADEWGWNCHQFFRTTEFYADFGVYEVEITLADHLKIGASGCKISDENLDDGRRKVKYHVEDVIDFAWVCYSEFEEHLDHWQHVEIKAMVPVEHRSLAPRLIQAVKNALEYLSENVGEYPFQTITIIDPPLHGFRSGLMEYPTLITGGSVYGAPKGFRGIESLIVHEFAHQYFMMMLASNEKEEAWLDEGFVTYYEDRIGINYFGEKHSQIDLFGFHQGNRETSRIEYTSLDNPACGITVEQGWEVKKTRYRELIYQKTATTLVSLERLIGLETMDKLMKTYFEKWKFKHPRGEDFIAIALDVVEKEKGFVVKKMAESLLNQALYTPNVCDFEVKDIASYPKKSAKGLFGDVDKMVFKESEKLEGFTTTVQVERKGNFKLPTEIELVFEDGSIKTIEWDAESESEFFSMETNSKIVSAHIDPKQKIYLDIDFNNNSITLQPEKTTLWKYALKTMFWVQNVLQSFSFFI